jgi:hypothetical protein
MRLRVWSLCRSDSGRLQEAPEPLAGLDAVPCPVRLHAERVDEPHHLRRERVHASALRQPGQSGNLHRGVIVQEDATVG